MYECVSIETRSSVLTRFRLSSRLHEFQLTICWWWCAGFLCLVIVWSSCFDNLCVGIPSLSAEQGLSRASSSQQHPLHPELAGSDHKHDAPDPVPTVSWLPRSPDDRSQARHRFRGVWGRQPVPYRDAGPPGLQDHPREPHGYILRQKMRSARNPCTRKIFFRSACRNQPAVPAFRPCIFGKNSLNLEVLTLSTFKSGLVLSLYAHPAFLLLSSLVLCLCRRRLHHLPDCRQQWQ